MNHLETHPHPLPFEPEPGQLRRGRQLRRTPRTSRRSPRFRLRSCAAGTAQGHVPVPSARRLPHRDGSRLLRHAPPPRRRPDPGRTGIGPPLPPGIPARRRHHRPSLRLRRLRRRVDPPRGSAQDQREEELGAPAPRARAPAGFRSPTASSRGVPWTPVGSRASFATTASGPPTASTARSWATASTARRWSTGSPSSSGTRSTKARWRTCASFSTWRNVPSRAVITIGATRYTELGETGWIVPGDAFAVCVYDPAHVNAADLPNLCAKGIQVEGMSLLVREARRA